MADPISNLISSLGIPNVSLNTETLEYSVTTGEETNNYKICILNNKPKPISNLIDTLGIPNVCLNTQSLEYVLGYKENTNNYALCVLDNTPNELSIVKIEDVENSDNFKRIGKCVVYNEWAKNIKINSIWLSENLNYDISEFFDFTTGSFDMEKYLHQSLENKKVFVDVNFNIMHYLPTHSKPYLILDKNLSTYSDSLLIHKKEIEFTDEKTLEDLYVNAWKYEYNNDTNSFIRLTEKGSKINALNAYLHSLVFRYGGSPYDRIADLSRLVLFLYSKVNLTDEEKIIFKPIIDQIQSANDIVHVINREGKINECINYIKKDPDLFFNKYILNNTIGDLL